MSRTDSAGASCLGYRIGALNKWSETHESVHYPTVASVEKELSISHFVVEIVQTRDLGLETLPLANLRNQLSWTRADARVRKTFFCNP